MFMDAHVQTGHHGYANEMRRTNFRAVDLANLSRDVCGLAVNVTTSALCLRRIVKLADFVLGEFQLVFNSLEAYLPSNKALLEYI